jgi:hypothetical protein
VPSPAAMTNTRGELTAESYFRRACGVESGSAREIAPKQRDAGQGPAGEDQVDAY